MCDICETGDPPDCSVGLSEEVVAESAETGTVMVSVVSTMLKMKIDQSVWFMFNTKELGRLVLFMRTNHTDSFVYFMTGDLEWFNLDFLNVYETEPDTSNLDPIALQYNMDEIMVECDYPTSKITKYAINPSIHFTMFAIVGLLLFGLTSAIHKIMNRKFTKKLQEFAYD